MIETVTGQKVVKWVSKRVDQTLEEIGNAVGIGVLIDGKPVAGIVFNSYRKFKHGADIHVQIASDNPHWCQRKILRYIFNYVFIELDCARITAIIKEGNKSSVKLCAGLGFKREGVIRRGYDGKTNALVYGMLKDQCRWIKHG
jgi:RimJ/RimL family protein N-acetyltransferase